MKHVFSLIGLLLTAGVLTILPLFYLSSTLYRGGSLFWVGIWLYSFLCIWLYKWYTSKFEMGKTKNVLWIPFLNVLSAVLVGRPLYILFFSSGLLVINEEFAKDDLGAGMSMLLLDSDMWIAFIIGSLLGFSKRKYETEEKKYLTL